MQKLLHIIATPRRAESRTLSVTEVFLETLLKRRAGWTVDELDLFSTEMPTMNPERVAGKYTLLEGAELDENKKKAWREIIIHIERFKSADAYLLSTPMWNFNIPYVLKQYIDVIVQPKYLFQYTPNGVEGLVKNKRLLVIASRGGDYRAPEAKGADFQEPYLRFIFGFVGIVKVVFIKAEPMDMGEENRARSLSEARELAKKAAAEF